MKPLGIRDIVGPIMVGPSSSHTAGALRIASMVRNLLTDEPARVTFVLYGSFAHTYRGHGTDRALVAGLLGLHTDDLQVKNSFDLAKEEELEFSFEPDPHTKVAHPNTVDVSVTDRSGNTVTARGVSIGGGAAELVRIDGIDVHVTGEFNNMIVRQQDLPGTLAHIAGTLGNAGINIGTSALHRKRVGGEAFTVLDIDDFVPDDVIADILAFPSVETVRFIPADGLHRAPDEGKPAMNADVALKVFQDLDFENAAQLLNYCIKNNRMISEVAEEREYALLASKGISEGVLDSYLARALSVMKNSAVQPIRQPTPSMGGLIGGEASRLHVLEESGLGVRGQLIALATRNALAVLETNATMGLIAAAPTAGSAGVIPAVLLALQEVHTFSDAQLCQALKNAGAIGAIIARNATVSGAEGGCQAEIGSAAAMAASAAVELLGGTPEMCLTAAGDALANMLGLVCDPIGGLVEAPCQKRNAAAAVNALSAAQMALAGIKGVVPFDEVVDAMFKVGRSIPYELRETALGGMAACPSCSKFCF